MALVEGQTGTAPDGTRVIVRGGRIVPYQTPKLTPQEEADLVDMRKAGRVMSSMTDQAKQFVDLNRKSATGPIYGIPVIGGALRSAMTPFQPELARMSALEARMAPQQRVPGSGTTSDRDLALFLQAIPSTNRFGNANAGIASDMEAMSRKQNALAEFADRYAMQRGTLKGVDEAFNKEWAARNARKSPAKPQAAPQRPSLDDIFR